MSDKTSDKKTEPERTEPVIPKAEAIWQSQTYLEWRRHLYEVVGWEDHETQHEGVHRMLYVVNCATDHGLWLSMRDLKEATPVPTSPITCPPADWKVAA
jgi:hypothetical protein